MHKRVALLSDIHGNSISFQAVLTDLRKRGIGQIVCLGDVAASGPQPAECLELLESIDPLAVMGNADAWLLDPQLNRDADEFHRKVEESDLWTISQLSASHLHYLQSFQSSHLLEAPTPLLAFHGTPRSNTESVLPTTPVEKMAAIFADRSTPLLAGGHTHQPFTRRFHEQTFINPGSVGLPYIIDRAGEAHNPPWAEYAIVSWGDGGGLETHVEIQLVRVSVDSSAIRRAILDSGMPHAELWAAAWQQA